MTRAQLVLIDAPVPVPSTPTGAARVSIVDFGADPTGIKDSTWAIQRALDVPRAQRQAALVLVPPGLFVTSDTLIVREYDHSVEQRLTMRDEAGKGGVG